MDSPNYSVGMTAEGKRSLDELDTKERDKVRALMHRMEQNPTAGASPLRHTRGQLWKKRIGDIRVLFTVDKGKRSVVIRFVAWRRDVYEEIGKLLED